MACNTTANGHTDEIIGGLVEVVASHLVGDNVVNSLRKKFMDQSCELLQKHLQMMELDDHGTFDRNIQS
jgi:hypothetical protein